MTSTTSALDRATHARGYAGPLRAGTVPSRGLVEVPIGNGGPMSIYDVRGYKTVHRAALPKSSVMNDVCMAAARLASAFKATYTGKHDRGIYEAHVFNNTKGSSAFPRASALCIGDYKPLYDQVRYTLSPVRETIHNIFYEEFPALCVEYERVADKICQEHPQIIPACYPFTSLCINSGPRGVMTERHIDTQNLAPGLCCVVPYGRFDPSQDSKIFIKELGFYFQVAAGMPIFFPSALYTHYNSKLITDGMRGSIVAWTGAAMFQYVDMGCRTVAQLTGAEYAAHKATLKERVLNRFDMFPRRVA
ncbi:hypothetical protein FB45DRAFT_1057115 [Roridomyces roridus]|uniref:Uncharacterized protein n=1 Tax=Roridomyces roridus TaxID=1738132 RepID=A0AAD7C021_9AGAR|nr:hypothetical protein FB45DRAFT_1057115 [Roridomyces roridus]